jgi:hypothetical protein
VLILRSALRNRRWEQENAAIAASRERDRQEQLGAARLSDAVKTREWLEKHNSIHRGDIKKVPVWDQLLGKSPKEWSKYPLPGSAAERKSSASASAGLAYRSTQEKLPSKVFERARSKPPQQPYGVSPRGAELLVSKWLEFLGEHDVQITQYAKDGGIDVETTDCVCQVKNYQEKKVSSSEVRDLLGAAQPTGKLPVLFTSSSLTQDAEKFCNANGIVAIRYDSENALLTALSKNAVAFLAIGKYSE